MAKHWHVACTQPNAESRARSNIERLNRGGRWVEARWLKYRDIVRRNGRSIDTFRALYPGYVFVQFDADTDPWRDILGCYGVTRIICDGDQPVPLPDDVAREVFARVDAAGIVHEDAPGLLPRRKLKRLQYKKGALIRVLDTAFQSIIAAYDRPVGKGDAVVNLRAFGGVVPLTLPERLIEPIDE